MNLLMLAALFLALAAPLTGQKVGRLVVSNNHRFLQYSDGGPFFWLGDTGWLLFKKLDRAEAERYLEDRRGKGFNVIQVMTLHTARDQNAYGVSALIDGDPARPNLTPAYSFWDHIEWIIDRAAEKGIYMAMVLAWGSIVQSGALNAENVRTYTRFLAARYGGKPNVIWLTGGDARPDKHLGVWRAMGETLRQADPNHLISFHPFGRTQSSTWFHQEPWLDFNMFQSGHRRYDQDAEAGAKGEDNWRYVWEDYAKEPPKPTLDGEPSYEEIPQGLHDVTQPYWTDKDCRRYAYWSVFAGACGHTYGHNAVMQMHKPDGSKGAYGPKSYWYEALAHPGATQMGHLKKLMLSRPYLERIPDQSLIAGGSGARYDYLAATRGASYAFVYAYSGRAFEVRLGIITGKTVRAWWYDPRTGAWRQIGTFPNRGSRRFTPPGSPAPGNDWVLVLDDAAANFGGPPGRAYAARIPRLPNGLVGATLRR